MCHKLFNRFSVQRPCLYLRDSVYSMVHTDSTLECTILSTLNSTSTYFYSSRTKKYLWWKRRTDGAPHPWLLWHCSFRFFLTRRIAIDQCPTKKTTINQTYPKANTTTLLLTYRDKLICQLGSRRMMYWSRSGVFLGRTYRTPAGVHNILFSRCPISTKLNRESRGVFCLAGQS